MSKMKEYLLDQYEKEGEVMSIQICVECNKQLEEGYHLSRLGTCPSCVKKWVEEYNNPKKRRERV